MCSEIEYEANRRYPRRWSGDVENSNNNDKFIEGAEWMKQVMVNRAYHSLHRILSKEVLDELIKVLKEE